MASFLSFVAAVVSITIADDAQYPKVSPSFDNSRKNTLALGFEVLLSDLCGERI